MGGHTTAMDDYKKYQNQLPAQKVGVGANGEMLAAPTAASKSDHPNSFGRDASKPMTSEEAIDKGLNEADKK